MIVWDFNYHFDCTSCPHAKQLQTLFSDNCLTQLIHGPTHCHAHSRLDGSGENNGSVSQCNALSTSFSDHDAIVGLTALSNSLTHCRVVSSRNLRKINSAEMEADIQHLLDTELADCTDIELTDWYSTASTGSWTSALHWPAGKWPTVRQKTGGQTASGWPKGNSGRLSASGGLRVWQWVRNSILPN